MNDIAENETRTYAKKTIIRLIILFTCLYITSYITRINYGAVIAEIVSAEGIKKSAASLALTISAITYGGGQLASGILGDKLNPKKLIFSGLLVTLTMNILIPLCRNHYQMMIVWGINGLAQAFMWPPLVKIMSAIFNESDYQNACMFVSMGASIGNILVYSFAPACIYFFSWRGIFYIASGCAAVMALVWLKACPNVNVKKEKSHTAEISISTEKLPKHFFLYIAIIIFTIALQGMLRDGVTTWMPSYISETFNLDSKIAILTGVIMPIFSIITIKIVSSVYRHINNEMHLTSIFFAMSALSAFVLFLTNSLSAVLSVALAALLEGCIHGVNWVQTCMIPVHFKKYGKVSFVSGLLNSGTYVGSSISGYGMALCSEHFGWNGTIFIWGIIAFLGCTTCLLFNKTWKNFSGK